MEVHIMTYKRKGRQERGSTREVKTRIPVDEYEEWKHRADLAGTTVAEYIRSCVREGKINVVIKNEIVITPLVDIAAIWKDWQQPEPDSALPEWYRYLVATIIGKSDRRLREMYATTRNL